MDKHYKLVEVTAEGTENILAEGSIADVDIKVVEIKGNLEQAAV